LKDLQELREDRDPLDPLVNPETRERSEFPASLVPPAGTVSRDPADCPVFLVLRAILERMESRERSDLRAPRDSREVRETLDLSAVLDQEDREERSDLSDLLETRDHPD